MVLVAKAPTTEGAQKGDARFAQWEISEELPEKYGPGEAWGLMVLRTPCSQAEALGIAKSEAAREGRGQEYCGALKLEDVMCITGGEWQHMMEKSVFFPNSKHVTSSHLSAKVDVAVLWNSELCVGPLQDAQCL